MHSTRQRLGKLFSSFISAAVSHSSLSLHSSHSLFLVNSVFHLQRSHDYSGPDDDAVVCPITTIQLLLVSLTQTHTLTPATNTTLSEAHFTGLNTHTGVLQRTQNRLAPARLCTTHARAQPTQECRIHMLKSRVQLIMWSDMLRRLFLQQFHLTVSDVFQKFYN